MIINSPLKGKLEPLESLEDGVFSAKIMGDGVVVMPQESIVRAPMAGKLVTVFPTGHAYGIEAKDGTKVLIHIGIDSVNLNGEGFDVKVKQGKKVKQGDPLVEVNFAGIKDQIPSIGVIMIVTADSERKIVGKTETGATNIEKCVIETA